MIEQEEGGVNPEASALSKNFLKNGWEKFLKTIDDNQNKIGVAMILVGVLKVAMLIQEPSFGALSSACVVLSLGIRNALAGRENTEEPTK